jgi:hypothetical protein
MTISFLLTYFFFKFKECNQTFDRLPLSSVIDHEIFCCHGGDSVCLCVCVFCVFCVCVCVCVFCVFCVSVSVSVSVSVVKVKLFSI